MKTKIDKKEYIQREVGANIRKLRMRNKISQRDLADMCNFETSNMCRIERGGSNLTLANLFKIATALNITMCELFEGVDVDPSFFD